MLNMEPLVGCQRAPGPLKTEPRSLQSVAPSSPAGPPYIRYIPRTYQTYRRELIVLLLLLLLGGHGPEGGRDGNRLGGESAVLHLASQPLNRFASHALQARAALSPHWTVPDAIISKAHG